MEFIYEPNRIFMQDDNGKTIAEVTFPALSGNTVDLNHTFVDGSLRGQGIAGRLVAAAAEKMRGEGKKVRPSCSYAQKWFDEHPEYADILLRDA